MSQGGATGAPAGTAAGAAGATAQVPQFVFPGFMPPTSPSPNGGDQQQA